MRLVWLFLLGVHVWPLMTALGGLATEPSLLQLGSLAVLLVLIPLFLVKAFDLEVARTRRPMVEFVVWLLCAGLVHARPLDEAAWLVPETALVVTVAAAASSRRVRRRVDELLRRLVGGVGGSNGCRPASGPAVALEPGPVSSLWVAVCATARIAARPPPSS